MTEEHKAEVVEEQKDEPKEKLVHSMPGLPGLPILDNTTVMVKKPADLAPAFNELIEWANGQIEKLTGELNLAKESLERAIKMKVATGGWKRQVKLWEGRVTYYSKLRDALKAGYFIMPDLPNSIDLFAIRTNQKSVKQRKKSKWSTPRLDDVKAKALPTGEGRYVDPTPTSEEWTEEETTIDKSTGKEETRTVYFAEADELTTEFDFPVKAVRPQVLESLDQATRCMIFDELGIIRPQYGVARKGDPIIVGRIIRREGGVTHGCSFLVHWWVDTRDL